MSELTNIENLHWHFLSGASIENLSETVKKEVNRLLSDGILSKNIKIITACDSQRRGNNVTYVTTIIILNIGHGGNALYAREIEDCSAFFKGNKPGSFERKNQIKNLIQRRLWNETLKAVNCALWLDSITFKDSSLKVSEVHVDVNTNKKFKSSELSKSILGYIDACGFIPKAKPDAWGASGIANIKTK